MDHRKLTLNNLGYLQLAVRDYAGARQLFEKTLFIKVKLAGNLLPTLAEAEALNYAEANQSGRDPLLSVLRQLPERPDDQAYAAVWNTRALVSRAVAARRPPPHPEPLSPQAGRGEGVRGSDPEADRLWEALRWKRAELAKLILAVPPPEKAEARQQKLSELTAEKERLQRELAAASAPFRR